MVRRLLFSLVLGLLALLPSLAKASAWVPEAHKGIMILNYQSRSSLQAFDEDGFKAKNLLPWTSRALESYGEYGLGGKWGLVYKTRFESLKSEGQGLGGFQGVELELDWQALKLKREALSLGVGLEGFAQGRRTDFDRPAGKLMVDSFLKLSYGRNFKKPHRLGPFVGRGFWGLSLERRFRSGFADQWRAELTWGIRAHRGTLVLYQLYFGLTDKEATLARDESRTASQTKWMNEEISIIQDLDRFGRLRWPRAQDWAIGLSVQKTLRGQNVPFVSTTAIKLWRRF